MVKFNFWRKSRQSQDQDDNKFGNINFNITTAESDLGNNEGEDQQIASYTSVSENARLEDTIYNKIVKYTVIISIFLIPLFFLPLTTNILEINKQILLLLLLGVGLISWLLGIVSTGWLSWRSNPIDKGVIAFLGAIALSAVFSVAQFKSVFGASTSLSNSLVSVTLFTLFYFLVVNNFKNKGKLLRSFLSLSVLIAVAYGLLQLLGIHVLRFSFSLSNSFNTIGSINALGILAAVSLPIFAGTRINISKLGAVGPHLNKIGFILSLIFLIILNWWVVWTVAIAGMLALVIFQNVGSSGFKVSKILVPMVVTVLAVFLMIVDINFNDLIDNFPVQVGLSFDLSRDIAWSTIKSSPIFGYGPENFSIAFDQFGAGRLTNSVLSSVRFSESSSEITTSIVSGGLLVLAALGFLFWLIIRSFLGFYKNPGNSKDQIMEDAAVPSSLAAIIVAMFVFDFNFTLFFIFYVLLALMTISLWNKNIKNLNIEEKSSLSIASSLGFIGGLIIVLVGAYFGSTIYLSDVKYARALEGGNTSEAARLLADAINLNGNDSRFYRSASQISLVFLRDEINNPSPPDQRNQRIQGNISSAVSFARRATEIAPRESLNWSNLGSVYQSLFGLVEGADGLSENAYLRASELRPGDANFFNSIGSLYLGKYEVTRRLYTQSGNQAFLSEAQNAIVKAEENFKKAIDISNNFGLAIYNLGAVYDRQGRLNEAITQLERVVPFNDDQPGLLFELGLLYYRVNRRDDAVNMLERAVLLFPQYSNARWYLALIREERGELDLAIEQLESILDVEVNRGNQVVMDKLNNLLEGITTIPPEDVLDQAPIQ